MKVNITKKTKEAIYASQLDAAKTVVACCKEEEETTPKWYAEMAAALLLDENYPTIYTAEAYVMPNCRVWNQYGEETGNLDVWIDFTAKSWETFIEGGCYLSDLWSLCSDNREEVKSHMYCLRYERPN